MVWLMLGSLACGWGAVTLIGIVMLRENCFERRYRLRYWTRSEDSE